MKNDDSSMHHRPDEPHGSARIPQVLGFAFSAFSAANSIAPSGFMDWIIAVRHECGNGDSWIIVASLVKMSL